MKNLAYYNGKITSIEDMMIPANDRGFYFGDGIYEVAMVFHHKIFALEDHLDRMASSAALVKIELPAPKEEIGHLLEELAEKVESPCQFLYWQITRATSPRNHLFPEGAASNLYVYSKPWKGVEMSDEYRLLSIEDTRFLHCNIKTLNLLPNVMAAQKAKEAGCSEAVFVRDGYVTEGSHSNISLIKDGVFVTHPLDNLILPGTERKHMIRYCGELGILVEERAFTLEEMAEADEIIVSSTSHPSMRAMELDKKAVGMKNPELVKKLRDKYMEEIEG
ncbi:D-amino acid aminotransferase [Clostridiaceae bacterium]|nr:D-amino acid aminotransferase [Clostridiaceae bacterium]RKI12461.1 D-amino acid aminotransferase [bacterium 1XD21-70]